MHATAQTYADRHLPALRTTAVVACKCRISFAFLVHLVLHSTAAKQVARPGKRQAGTVQGRGGGVGAGPLVFRACNVVKALLPFQGGAGRRKGAQIEPWSLQCEAQHDTAAVLLTHLL